MTTKKRKKAKRSHASYVAAGKKAARTRKRNAAKHGGRKVAKKRKAKRSHASYVAAGRKAARTRKARGH